MDTSGLATSLAVGRQDPSLLDSWAAALDDVVFEDRPHNDEAFADYLWWYLPRMRTPVVHVPPEARIEAAAVSETYPVVRDQNFTIAVHFSD